jgi:hypothetical protein
MSSSPPKTSYPMRLQLQFNRLYYLGISCLACNRAENRIASEGAFRRDACPERRDAGP